MYLPNDIDPAHIVIKTGKTVGPKGEVAPAPPIKVQPWAKEQKIEF
jgi:hypothetical protein